MSMVAMSWRAFLAALLPVVVACGNARASAVPQGEPSVLSGLVLQKYALRGTGRAQMEPESARAIAAGLEWLRRHQGKDGRWDCDEFMLLDRERAPCDGAGGPACDVGVSGLALLAFLADTDSRTIGRHEQIIFDGLKWLRGQQQADGLFGTNETHDFIYNHSIATYAMCEAAAIINDVVFRRSAQRGLDYLESHRNPNSAWRYQSRDNENDTSVTGWCTMACATGDAIGLQVDSQALLMCSVFLDQVSDSTGKHGYIKAGECSARQSMAQLSRFPSELGEALTAIGLQCRYFLGQDPVSRPVMKAAAKLLMSKLPQWDVKRGSIDLYYWYHGSQAMAQVGGTEWVKWRTALASALLPNQRADDNFAGSWDPVSVWGQAGGRIYSTALSVLSLQAEYRYAKLLELTPLPDISVNQAANRAFREQRFQSFANHLDNLLAKNGDNRELVSAIAAARVSLAHEVHRGAAEVDRIAKEADYWVGSDRLTEIANRFGSLETGVAARAVIDEWRSDPKVKRELAAMKRFEDLDRRLGEAKDERRRKLMRKEIERHLRTFQGTCAAKLIEKLLEKIK